MVFFFGFVFRLVFKDDFNLFVAVDTDVDGFGCRRFFGFFLVNHNLRECEQSAEYDTYHKRQTADVGLAVRNAADKGGKSDKDCARDSRHFGVFDDIFSAKASEQSVYDATECGGKVRRLFNGLLQGRYRKAQHHNRND